MLSPRTLSLRAQNRALLNALKKTSQEGPYDSKGCCSQLLPSKCTGTVYSCSCNCCTLAHSNTYVTDMIEYQKINAAQMDAKGDFHKIMKDLIAGIDKSTLSEQPIVSATENKDKNKSNSESSSLARKSKFVSSLQRRAAEAQMHAQTHTHSASKCYCTSDTILRSQMDNRYMVQLYGRRQRIPVRLKKQRYRADAICRKSRTVRWADNQDLSSSCAEVDDREVSSDEEEASLTSENLLDSSQISTSRPQVTHSLHASQTSLLDKVKLFRESHWSDCHASSQTRFESDHKCMQHYIPNKRLFLEPVYKETTREIRCPVCLVTDNQNTKVGASEISNSVDGSPSHSHIMVTLPKLLLDHEFPHKMLGGPPIRVQQQKIISDQWCHSLLSHHRKLTEGQCFPYPIDSLALKYQKKVL